MMQSYYLTWCFIIRIMLRPHMVYYKHPCSFLMYAVWFGEGVSSGEQLPSLKEAVAAPLPKHLLLFGWWSSTVSKSK